MAAVEPLQLFGPNPAPNPAHLIAHPFHRHVMFLGRPLLTLHKSRLKATCQRFEQAWIEDPSNRSEQFDRVRARLFLRDFQLNKQHAQEPEIPPVYLSKPNTADTQTGVNQLLAASRSLVKRLRMNLNNTTPPFV